MKVRLFLFFLLCFSSVLFANDEISICEKFSGASVEGQLRSFRERNGGRLPGEDGLCQLAAHNTSQEDLQLLADSVELLSTTKAVVDPLVIEQAKTSAQYRTCDSEQAGTPAPICKAFKTQVQPGLEKKWKELRLNLAILNSGTKCEYTGNPAQLSPPHLEVCRIEPNIRMPMESRVEEFIWGKAAPLSNEEKEWALYLLKQPLRKEQQQMLGTDAIQRARKLQASLQELKNQAQKKVDEIVKNYPVLNLIKGAKPFAQELAEALAAIEVQSTRLTQEKDLLEYIRFSSGVEAAISKMPEEKQRRMCSIRKSLLDSLAKRRTAKYVILTAMAIPVGLGLGAISPISAPAAAGIGAVVLPVMLVNTTAVVHSALYFEEERRKCLSTVDTASPLCNPEKWREAAEDLDLAVAFLPVTGATALKAGKFAYSVYNAGVLKIIKGEAKFGRIGALDNKAFIEGAQLQQPEQGKRTYTTIDMAPLKDLNDQVIKDKSLVTRYSDTYKEVFMRRLANSPLISQLDQQYSDFKNLRFAFNGEPGAVEEELVKIYKEVAGEYDRLIRDAADGEWLKNVAPEHMPVNWNLAGVGDSVRSADQNAREARGMISKFGTPLARSGSQDEKMARRLTDLQSARETLARDFKNQPEIIAKLPNGEKGLSPAALEIVYKTSEGLGEAQAIQAIRQRLKNRLQVEASDTQVRSMLKYVQQVDTFSPGHLQVKRVRLELPEENVGSFSIDFAGQKVVNLNKTQEKVLTSKNPKEVLRATDVGDLEATAILQARQNQMRQSIAKVEGDEATMAKVQFTGDDGRFNRTLPREKRESILMDLAQSDEPRAYRMLYKQEDLAPRNIDIIDDVGPKVEKDFRKRLEGKLSETDMRDLAAMLDFGAVGNTATGSVKSTTKNAAQEMTVQLSLANRSGTFSQEQKAVIQDAFERAVKKYENVLKSKGEVRFVQPVRSSRSTFGIRKTFAQHKANLRSNRLFLGLENGLIAA